MFVLRNIGHSRVSPDQRRFWGICGSLEGDGSCFTCSEPAPASAGTSEALPMWIQMARLSQLGLRLTLDCKSSPRRCPLLTQVTFNLVRIHAWSWDLSPEPSVGKRTAAGSGQRAETAPNSAPWGACLAYFSPRRVRRNRRRRGTSFPWWGCEPADSEMIKNEII